MKTKEEIKAKIEELRKETHKCQNDHYDDENERDYDSWVLCGQLNLLEWVLNK
jgi:hypothetical protein